MVLLNRRKILASLTPQERAKARKAYQKCAKDSGVFAIVGFTILYAFVFLASSLIESHYTASLALDHEHNHHRLLNETNVTGANETPETKVVIGPPNFPPYWISPYKNGGVIVYIIGMIYTFMGLAVVCDEFFVPALEVMIEKFQISEDVAGATLMAVSLSSVVNKCILFCHETHKLKMQLLSPHTPTHKRTNYATTHR